MLMSKVSPTLTKKEVKIRPEVPLEFSSFGSIGF